MKNILTKFLLIFLLSVSNSFSQMTHSVSKDEFKGTTSHYIRTSSVSPNLPLSFPYEDTKSTLMVGCKVNSHYWAYVHFNKVNLVDGNIGDGYYSYTLEIKAKDGFHKVMASQEHGASFIFFDMLDSDKKTVTRLMRQNDEIWIQFNHYQDGKRFYKYDTRGFAELFDKNCTNVK